MSDCLRAGKNHLGIKPSTRSTQLCISPRWVYRVPASLELRQSTCTCVEWQVTLSDPIRQVTLLSFDMGYREKLYAIPIQHVLYADNGPHQRFRTSDPPWLVIRLATSKR